MTEKRTYVEFADFSGGDSGRERPLPNQLNKYRGLNTWVYPNGAVAPRPPLVALTYTGLPTGKTLRTFTTSVSGGAWLAWSFSDGTVYSVVGGGAAAALRGTLSSDPVDALAIGDSIFFISASGTGGGAVNSVGTFTPVTMPQAELLGRQASQTLALHCSDAKLYWSDPDDPTSWPAANAVFIGDRSPATGLYIQRDTIVITKLNGEVWMFTGTLGVNETLRRLDIGLLHPSAGNAKGAVVGNSVLYYTTGSKMTAFTGGQLKTLTRPDMPPATGFNSSPKSNNVGAVVSAGEPNQFLVMGTVDQVADPTIRRPWFHSFAPDQGWNRHTFPVADYIITSAAMGGLTSPDTAKAIRTSLHINGAIFFCRPSDAAGVSTIKHFLFVPRLETPYSVSIPMQWGPATATNDGDLTTPVIASLQSGEFWAPEGRDCHVRALIIDYSWDADTALDGIWAVAVHHKFDVTVEALQRDGGSSNSSTSQTVVASGGNSIDGGTMTRTRVTLRMGDQGPGPGFRWKLADWRGIMVHRVIAVLDIAESRF